MLKFALGNLFSRPIRSALSLLGLTVAIAGMVGLFAVKGGLEKTVDDTFRMIPGLTVMQPGSPVPLFSRLPAAWEEELRNVEGVGVVNAQIAQRANLIEGKMSFNPPRFLLGLDIPSRLQLKRGVYREHLVQGRFLQRNDIGTNNAVISRQIAEQFHKRVGDTLQVDRHTLRIVGIYQTDLPLLDVLILMDIGRVREMTRFDPDSVSIYYIEKSDESIPDEELKRRIQDTFRGRRIEEWRPSSASNNTALITGLPLVDALLWLVRRLPLPRGFFPQRKPPRAETPQNSSDRNREDLSGEVLEAGVEVRSADDWAQRVQQFSEELDIFLTVMTGIGISIALLSIINTMLMSVTERIIEFGILKANGWSRRDVLRLITLESGLLGLTGGLSGAALGWGMTLVLNNTWPEQLHLFAGPDLLIFSILFSCAVGVAGGLYPAVWAMRMMPMEAIRRG